MFDIFDHNKDFPIIMKHLLEASMDTSFNGVMITEAGTGYPVVYVNAAGDISHYLAIQREVSA